MEEDSCYENYPSWIPILSNSVSISIYIIGAYILLGFGILWSILYLIYCLVMEILVLKRSCVHCYYYGKICAFGRGKLCSKLFKKGDPQKFIEREISWLDLLPDFMVIIIPIVSGIILLILNFSWILLILLILTFILFFVGTAAIRGSLACKHCKQRELGCPAAKAFFKENTDNK
ncbi:MAG: hypothetical protein HWN66_14235 [Candidatus Helarchaeota archaeon]|nr:hypothetical protein [Candidatus Helarchaeota archaeon]